MPIAYDTNAPIEEILDELLADDKYNEFNDLRQHEIKFKVVGKSKLTKDDELVSSGGHPAEMKKISDLHRVFIDAHYILVVDDYEWREADANRKKAMIHRALMSIKAEAKTNGDIKLGARKPDVAEFSATISRFGPTTPEIESFVDTLQNAVARINSELLTASGRLKVEVRTSEDEDASDLEDEADEPVKKRLVKPKKRNVVDEEDETTSPPVKKKRAKSEDDDEPPSSLGADEEDENDDDDDEDKLRTTPVKRRTTPLTRSEA